MAGRDGLPERIGKAVGELDIDFDRLTAAGWAVGLSSLAAGLTAFAAAPRRNLPAEGPPFVFGVTTITVAVGLFLALRRLLAAVGVRLVKPPGSRDPKP